MGLIQFLIVVASFVFAGILIITFGLHRERGEVVGIHVGPVVGAIMIVVVALFIDSAFGEIGAGERGVVTRFGAVTGQELNPGLYTIMPVVNAVVRCNVQIQAYQTDAEAVSTNLQDVHTKVTLNYHIKPESCVSVVRDLNNDLEARIVHPGVQESVKAATAEYSAEALIQKRPIVRDQMEKFLSDRLQRFGASVDALSVTNFQFSPNYTQAIESKAVVEQQVQQARLELERVAITAQQKVKQAQADAEATRLNGQAQAAVLAAQKAQISPELVKLRQVEALQRWIEKWDGRVPNTVIGQGQGMIPFINLPGAE